MSALLDARNVNAQAGTALGPEALALAIAVPALLVGVMRFFDATHWRLGLVLSYVYFLSSVLSSTVETWDPET